MTYDFDMDIDRRDTGSSKWSRYPSDILPMWVADMDFPVAPEIICAIEDRLKHPVLGYGVARDALRERIVAAMASEYGWTIAPEEIVFLPGVEPGVNMALKAFLSPGDGVAVQTPMYRPILNAPGHWDLARIEIGLVAGADGYEIDFGTLEDALSRSRALILCNPHNPTGKVYTQAELARIAELCTRHRVLIVSDEIHCELLFDGRKHIPIASLAPEVAARTITLMAASKTYNIAGLKTAFAIVPDKALRERFAAHRLGMVDSVNVLGLEATLAAYTHAGDWKTAMLAYLTANRDHLVEAIATRLPGITIYKPQSTFLAWLDCSALGLGQDPQAFFLAEAKVGCSSGTEFGSGGADHLRLNFGCTRATLDRAIDLMEAALRRRATKSPPTSSN